MFHGKHLGDEIGGFDQFGLGIAPGHDDVQIGAPVRKRREHVAEVEMIVTQRNIEFIEDQQLDGRIFHQLHSLAPRPLRGGDVARTVLRFPCEAFTERVPRHLILETFDRVSFARLPGAFAELHHATLKATTDRAKQKTEGRRRFTLALAGVNDEEPLLDRLLRHFGVLHGLAVRHLRLVARFLVGLSCHGSKLLEWIYFKMSGKPAAIKTARSAMAAIAMLTRPCASRNSRASALSGTIPRPTSLETTTTGPLTLLKAATSRCNSVVQSCPASMTLLSQSVRQSISTGCPSSPCAAIAAGKSSGASTVRHLPSRLAWCVAIRADISSS